jgi:hypothetical protein
MVSTLPSGYRGFGSTIIDTDLVDRIRTKQYQNPMRSRDRQPITEPIIFKERASDDRYTGAFTENCSAIALGEPAAQTVMHIRTYQ